MFELEADTEKSFCRTLQIKVQNHPVIQNSNKKRDQHYNLSGMGIHIRLQDRSHIVYHAPMQVKPIDAVSSYINYNG